MAKQPSISYEHSLDSIQIPGGAVSLANTEGNTSHDGTFSDIFFQQGKIDATRWGQYFPYQLIMLEADHNGGYSIYNNEVLTLPISPSELQVRTPFAINLSVTLRGILEEHNGAPLREISFSGTTGILPGDAHRVGATVTQPSILGTMFAGTIQKAGHLTKSFQTMIGNKPSNNTDIDPNVMLGKSGLTQTGYYHFRMLDRFIERYVLIKKGMSTQNPKPDSKRIRLALTNWKEEAIWLITPRDWTWRKTASDPHQYFYSFSATAWKRMPQIKDLGPAALAKEYVPLAKRPNGFQTALNTLHSTRTVIFDAKGVVEGFRGDINNTLLEPMREVTLMVKEAAGAARTLYDLPGNIKSDFQQTVARSWGNLKDAYQTFDHPDNDSLAIQQAMDDQARDALNQTADQTRLSDDASASPITKLFNDTFADPRFFDGIELQSLDTPAELSDAVDAEVNRVTALERADLVTRRDNISAVSEQLANQLGVGSATYTRLIGSDSGSDVNTYLAPTASAPLTDDQLDLLFSLQRSVQVFDGLVSSTAIDDDRIPSSMEYVAALANAAQIPFSVPQSQYLVPVPLGFSLETIALTYLGSADRWPEIATLNGLRSPYIDEVGFTLSFLTNGTNHQFFTVNDSTNLFVGQNIKLFSDTVPISKHRIVSIETISESNFLITVDGDSLNNLKVTDHAAMRAFLPGTTNSEQLIYIPSQAPSLVNSQTLPVPGIDAMDQMVQISGIDLMLTSTGDLAMSSDGDLKLAFGLTNLVQACRMKMSVPRGSLLRHPSFGFGIDAGVNTADLTMGAILKSIQGSFSSDERFAGVSSLQVQKRGTVLQIDLSTEISGINVLVPVSLQIPATR